MDIKLENELRQLPPDVLVELLLYAIEPSSDELVDAFQELIELNENGIKEELSEYGLSEGSED